MIDSSMKWLVEHAEHAALLCVGSFLYATIRYRQLYDEGKPQSAVAWALDFFVAGGCGVIFMYGGFALGLEGAQIGFIGGVGGYMGPRGMKTLGDTLTRISDARFK